LGNQAAHTQVLQSRFSRMGNDDEDSDEDDDDEDDTVVKTKSDNENP